MGELIEEVIAAPSFDSLESPRILVEEEDEQTRRDISRVLISAGFNAVSCSSSSKRDLPCPLEVSKGCGAVEEADVIFFSLDLNSQRSRHILKEIKLSNPRVPIVVEITEQKDTYHLGLLLGTTFVYSPLTRENVTKAVRDAWKGPDRRQRILRETLSG